MIFNITIWRKDFQYVALLDELITNTLKKDERNGALRGLFTKIYMNLYTYLIQTSSLKTLRTTMSAMIVTLFVFSAVVHGHRWYERWWEDNTTQTGSIYYCKYRWNDGHLTNRYLASAHSQQDFESINEAVTY